MFDSLKHAVPAGLSRQQALQRILSLRPDHEAALHAALALALDTGDQQRAEQLQHRLQRISPLAR